MGVGTKDGLRPPRSWLKSPLNRDLQTEMAKSTLDEIDRRIAAALQRDGWMTMQDLAAHVAPSALPCSRRVRMLEAAGLIMGYVALVDQAKVGLPISVFASIKLERQREEDLDRFARAVARWPEVADCHLMTGQLEYLMRIVVGDL